MVHSVEALGLVVPFQKREVRNPQRLEHVSLSESKTRAHFQTQGSQGNLCLVPRSAENQYEISLLRIAPGSDFLNLLRSVELVYGGFDLIAEFYENQAFCANLRAFYPLGEFVCLLAGITGTTRNGDGSHILSAVKHGETVALDGGSNVVHLHPESQVRFV